MRILFVSSEIFPFAKTGGLADVSASLPRALQAIGHQVCVLMPAYRGVLGAAQHLGVRLRHATELEGHSVRLFESRLPGSRNRLWLLDCPALFDRPGNPYHDAEGRDWPDNAQRFALLCRVAALLARDGFGLSATLHHVLVGQHQFVAIGKAQRFDGLEPNGYLERH